MVAKEVDKGSGLLALRDWVLGADAETIAVGDQEPDLAMFRVATRSFAPANIGCARQARLLGCGIARHAYQRGLLEIARALIASGHGGRCETLRRSTDRGARRRPFMDVLARRGPRGGLEPVRVLLRPARLTQPSWPR